MPYPAQITRAAIVAAAYALIERDGIARLTLAQLAEALGVRAPSLYRHVSSRAALIQLVNTHTIELLFAAFGAAIQGAGAEPAARLRALLHAHRAFAHAHPTTYALALSAADPEERPDERMLEGLALPLQAIMAEHSGPERALPALRGALALAHGFAMLELSGQLRRGGDLDAAFAASVDAYLRGWGAVRMKDEG